MKKLVQKTSTQVKCWNLLLNTYYDNIVSLIYEHKFLWYKWYTTEDYVPYIENPVYDGEHATNDELNRILHSEHKCKVQEIIESIKRSDNK